jgi:hypothetical protein
MEAAMTATRGAAIVPPQRAIFWQTSVRDPNLSSISQAGLVNNLNDGMACQLFRLRRRRAPKRQLAATLRRYGEYANSSPARCRIVLVVRD